MNGTTSRSWLWWLSYGTGTFALALIGFFALTSTPSAAAQGDLGLAISKRLAGDSIVQIGQILTFTIRITNTRGLPLSELQVTDRFQGEIVAPSGVGPFAEPGDPALVSLPRERWSYDGDQTITVNLLGPGEQLREGEAREFQVRLRAVHPTEDLRVVNEAEIARAIRSDGRNDSGSRSDARAEPRGARLPLSKTLNAPLPLSVGLPITFTIVITNNSLIDLVELPLADFYNPSVLQFVRADPPPSAVNATTGILEWNDLLAITGRSVLRPGEALVVQTSYIALAEVDAAVNRAQVSGARDKYNNALVPRQAEAPIRVVGPARTPTTTGVPGATTTTSVPGATTTAAATTTTTAPGATETATMPAASVTAIIPATSQPTETERPSEEPTATETRLPTAGARLTEVAERRTQIALASLTPTPTLTPVPTETAPIQESATLTPTPALPASLPVTGSTDGVVWPWLALAIVLLSAGLLLHRKHYPDSKSR